MQLAFWKKSDHWTLVIWFIFSTVLASWPPLTRLNRTIAGRAMFLRRPRVTSFRNIPMPEMFFSFPSAKPPLVVSFLPSSNFRSFKGCCVSFVPSLFWPLVALAVFAAFCSLWNLRTLQWSPKQLNLLPSVFWFLILTVLVLEMNSLFPLEPSENRSSTGMRSHSNFILEWINFKRENFYIKFVRAKIKS